jgi:hypothetical protein
MLWIDDQGSSPNAAQELAPADGAVMFEVRQLTASANHRNQVTAGHRDDR